MSTTGVYNALNGYIHNNQIDLWEAANGSAELSGMLPVLGLFRISSSYIVTSVALTQSADNTSVRLAGQGFFAGEVSYAASVTLRYFQGSNSFSLTLTLKGSFVFSDFFSFLPPTILPSGDGGGLVWSTSILTTLQINSGSFTATTGDTQLTVTGFLPEPADLPPPNYDLLVRKTPMIGPYPLRLSGTMDLPTTARNYPVMNIDARGNSTIIQGEQTSGVNGPSSIPLLNPGLTIISAPLPEEQLGNTSYSTIELYGDFSIGGINGRISTLILSAGRVWAFSVVFDPATSSLVQGLAQLLGIFGVELPVPMNFPLLSDFYVAEIDIDLENTGTDASPSFSLLNFAITIRSDKVWNPPIPFVTFSNVGTRWVWGWSTITNEQGNPENLYTLTGSVFGTMNIGGSGSGTVTVIPPADPDPSGGSAVTVIKETKPVSILMSMSLPDFIISASLASGSYISISDMLNFYFGNSGPSTGKQQMSITRLRFTADPIGQNYFANAVILFGDPAHPDDTQGWSINLLIVTIVLKQVEFNLAVNNGNVSGSITGTLFLLGEETSDYTVPRLIISAEYPPQTPETPAGWTLMGYLYPGTSIDIWKLVYQYIYGGAATEPPQWVKDLGLFVDRLLVKYTTGTYDSNGNPVNPSYEFGGTISMRWTPTIFGTQLSVNASASMDLEKKSDAEKASGKVTGSFSVNKISITASLTFGVPEPTYLLKVQIMELWFQATTSWRGEQNNRHQVVSLQLGGITLGDILEYLVNLAAPTIGFSLDPPWDVLKKVDLSRFVLTIDPQENTVEFVFEANVDLVIANIKTIGVRYSRSTGEGKVDLILTGSFLGQQYTDKDPLAWDVVNDPPPAVPGQGESLINLRYIGIGQRVTFKGPTPNTVADSIALLRKSMTPPPADGDPMTGSGMEYAADSQWLIGLDVQLMETVDLAIIFNDPKLYGLSIALGGEKAGSLAGLRFEILYKKITDEIGMFRIEFQVPDMFRTIQLGVVSITLGIIVIEIYTNGNFKIDLGFPYNQDFSRSFSLQAYIFIGRGGFYLGVLNGDTSTQVPKITNGNFSPVIELGIGIAAGVGREIRAGILSGGAYVELQVIFQGVLAWFNPNSSGAASAVYFKAQGIAALHGKIYGSVDFAVVKVSVTLEAYAQISLSYESYQPLQITMMVSVRAEASIKILFIKIHFSFSVKLEISFTVGSAQPTPWILAGGSSGGTSSTALRSHASPHVRNGQTLRRNTYRRIQAMRRTYHAEMKTMLFASAENMLKVTSSEDLSQVYILNWKPNEAVFTDSPRKAHLTLLPMFTIADVPVNWDGTVPANDTPVYRTAFVLFADSGIDVGATTAAARALRSSAHSGMTGDDTDTSLLAADILAQGLTLYAVNALPRSSTQGNYITAGDLEVLLEQLDLPEAMDDGLSVASLTTFFSTNINLWISGDTDPRPDEKSAMVLPMPPFLRWTSEQAGDVDFSTENKIGAWYEWGIQQFLSTYFPVSGDETEKPATDDPASYESFTSFMFRDFCMMVMQNAIKEMQKHMNDTTVTVTTVSGVVQTLSQVAKTLPNTTVDYTIQSGDTVDSVAARLGATAEELEFLNPDLASQLADNPVGTVLDIVLGIAPEILALDNPAMDFSATNAELVLGTLVHQVDDATNTLQSIADLFLVADVATMLRFSEDGLPVLASGSNILNAASTFSMPAQVFSNAPADFVQLRTAAAFYIRYNSGNVDVENAIGDTANWYAQAIAELNQPKLSTLFPDQTIPSETEVPPGQTLTVPNNFGAAYTESGNTNTYTTVNGDTLGRIGRTLALQQDYATALALPGWTTFQTGVTSAGANSWNIPLTDNVKIEVAQTFESLVRRMIVNATWTGTDPNNPSTGYWTYDWNSVQVWVASATILVPLASITVPAAKAANSPVLNFSKLSSTYGLTVTDAAARLKDVPGLYDDGTVLLVKLLPAQDIDVLIGQVLQGDSFASIVNQSSRMLMSGLQLPGLKTENGHVVPDDANPLPLYDLTAQQFTLPVDKNEPAETALALELFSEQPWIELFSSITVQQGQTLEQLEQTYPNLLVYNPGLNENTFKVGMVLLTDTAASLDYSYTNQQVIDESPASGLAVQPIPDTDKAPAVLAVSGTVPRTYGLDHRVELQTPVTLPIPQSGQVVTGNPGMWPLPAALQAKATAGVTTLYEVLAAPLGGEAGAVATQIDSSTYGTVIPFTLKRLNGSSSQFNLIGVDTDRRAIVIALSNWLREGTNSTNTVSYQLLSPSPDAANTSGVQVLSVNASDAFIVKSNLSTISVPPSFAVRAKAETEEENGNVYFASMSSLADFLMLLWEGSVVGGTGYYFSPGQELPGSAFDQQGNVTLQILVIAGSQQAVAPDGRSLLPFNNCVLIAPGNENTQASLYMQSDGDTSADETITQALVPPGNVGFELYVNNPETESSSYTASEILLKTYYSLLSFEVAPVNGSPFAAASPGMPVLPNPVETVAPLPAWQQQRTLRKAAAAGLLKEEAPLPYWQYTQVMPVSRFIVAGTTLAAPDVNGLPYWKDDPYQGYGTQSTLPSASFVFAFGDVLGNRTGANGSGQGTTVIPVGYTDNIIGIAEWPSIGRFYEVKNSEQGAVLTLTISPRASELLPNSSQNGTVNAAVIAQQQEQYAGIYYQLIQPEVEGWIVSSLNYIADPDYGNKGVQVADISPLWKFAAGWYAALTGLSQMTAAKPQDVTTLDSVISAYGIRYTELAQANAQTLLASLFGSTIPVVPAYYPNVENRSMGQLAGMPPKGWPAPTPLQLLTFDQNASLLLVAGVNLVVPPTPVETGTVQPTVSIQSLATANHTTVYDLAVQNAGSAVLEEGFVFTMPVNDSTITVSVKVDSTVNTFALVVDAFAALGVNTNAAEVANVHKDISGMFAINETLTYATYLIENGDTLKSNSSGQSVSTIAGLNINTPNLFDPGALIYFGNFSGVTEGDTPLTLQEFADRYACPVEVLLSANGSFTLPQNSAFVVPGTLAWPSDTSIINVPYTIRTGETLNAIAARFSFTGTTSAAQQLAAANENMPGTITPNMDLTVAVGGTSYTVSTGNQNPSYASVLTSLQQQAPAATLADVVNATAGTAGVLFGSALFLCPLAKLAADTAPVSIPVIYGITASSFALVNTATQNLIAAGNVLYDFGTPENRKSVTTIMNDTFNSLIARFAEQGVTMSASDIVAANPAVAFLANDALALLPPAEISFSTNIGQGGPYAGTVVPLQTSLRLLRPEALIYPSFKTATGTGPVEMAESDFPAPTSNSGPDSGLTLNDFVSEMMTALPDIRIGTGKVSGVVQDLWQINFDSNGISDVELKGAITVNAKLQPRFFALKPLYRFLVTRTINVQPLKPDGELGDAVEISYQSIDVELWGRRFVADMDMFLSGPYAVAVYNDTGIRAQLTSVLDSKNALMPQIAAGLDTVLAVTDPGKDAGRASAVASLEQQLGVSLSRTYEANVLIQYDSVVDSTWQHQPGLLPVSLYGDGTIFEVAALDEIAGTDTKVPGLSMIAAKTDLSEADSFVNFLVTLDNPSLQKDIAGKFTYDISHFEFNISGQNMPGDYKASDWLTFVPLLNSDTKPAALSKTDPTEEVDVPVPLRNFPDLPKIVNQSALQSVADGSQDTTKLGLWDYAFIYSHQHAAQDYVLITAEFNLTTPKNLRALEDDPQDLFTELAQYMAVADELWSMLNGLTGESTYAPDVIQNAVKTYAEISADVAQWWYNRLAQDNFSSGNADNMEARLSYHFNSRVAYTLQGLVESLKLTALDAQPGPNNTWPDAYVYGFKLVAADGQETEVYGYYLMDKQAPDSDSTTYLVPADVTVGNTWPQFKIVWPALNVAAVQNARVQMSVERNQDLVEGVKTNPEFIFTTDTVIAPAVVTPLNNFGVPVNINALGSDLTTALNSCFSNLFGINMNDQLVTMELSYGFELVAPSESDAGLVTYLPIGLYPNQKLSSSTAATINTIVTDWQRINQPVTQGGEWVFSLKLYSQQTDHAQTLLNVEHLVYRLGRV